MPQHCMSSEQWCWAVVLSQSWKTCVMMQVHRKSMQVHQSCGLGPAGADTLKSALQALGLKCGGTLRQRAERLMLTKTTPLEQLDQKLFVKGAAPQVGRVHCLLRPAP